MKEEKESKPKYHTPTSKILMKMQFTKNPVTRAVYREIVGNRIDNQANDRN